MNTAMLEIGLRMIGHVWKNRLAGRERYPIVAMLEPLEVCNLACKGCGRIREYHESVIVKKTMVPVEKCLQVAAEAGAPVVSIAGGEPLIHPQIDQIVEGILAQNRFVFLCTNGLLMEQALEKIKPSRKFNWVVHLDGTAQVHDYWAERAGVWEKAVRAMQLALDKGYRVCVNTTVYKNSDMDDLHRHFQHLTDLGVEGIMISAGYPYQCVPAQDIFLERQMSQQTFRQALDPARKFSFYNNPLYLDFLRGERDYPCRAWTNPTYTPLGWRKPCYLIADEHTSSLEELLDPSLWEQYGPGADPRCASCTMHSGYEAGIVQQMFSTPQEFAALLASVLRNRRNGRLKPALPAQGQKLA